MKKIKKFFFNLSLARQFLIIFAIIFLSLIFIVAPMIDKRVKKIVDDQIYESISSQQSVLVDLIENNVDWLPIERFSLAETLNDNIKVKHFIYNVYSNRFARLSDYPSDQAQALMDNIFYSSVLQMQQSKQSVLYESVLLDGDTKLYYIISTSSNLPEMYWISFEYSEISSQLLNDMRNQLVNVLYVFLLVIAFILIVWIYTMIRPLSLIQSYIHSIKKGQPFELSLQRNDEIGEVGKALIDMENELSIQKQLQSDLIHNISHDLKTPITIIRSYAESMKEGIYPYGNIDSSLDIILENTDRLEKKVKDFLYLNRLDYLKEKQEMNEEVDMQVLIQDIIFEFHPLMSHISLVTNLQEVSFIGKQEHWHSCVTNILENALRYASSQIKITLQDNFLSIYNDGEAIDEEIINELFKPYTKGPKGNYGLGLSIVYKIVDLYGYHIEVINKDNGVEFIIKKIT